MMNIRKILFALCCICLSGMLVGCQDTDRKPDEASLKIQSLEEEISTLNSKLQHVNQELEVLGAENQRLNDRYSELGEWANRMVSRFGPGIWYVNDLTYPFFIKPMKSGGIPELIDELNQRFKKAKLPEVIYLGQENHTVLVGVSDDNLLTRKLGSFGATSYMNAVVFTLASVEDVTCVQFKFEEGDHAVPGTYCRNFLAK